jgi:hypothetical protein
MRFPPLVVLYLHSRHLNIQIRCDEDVLVTVRAKLHRFAHFNAPSAPVLLPSTDRDS